MRLRHVIFALLPGRPRRIEIPQTRVPQAMNAMKPRQHLLHEQFRFAIRVRGMKCVAFFDRRAFRRAIKRGRGRKHQPTHFVLQHRFQQVQRVCRIVPEIFLGNLHGFAGFDERRKVHHRIDAVFAENTVETGAVRGISVDELRVRRHRAPAAVREIVADNDFAALREKLRRHHASDVARSSGDENAIGHLVDCSFSESRVEIRPASSTDYIKNRARAPACGEDKTWAAATPSIAARRMIHLAAAKASPFREAPHSSMYGARSRIIFSNCAKSSDCAPSLMAFSGAGCTSTINPSAPMATPARATAGTKLRLPVAWLGSKIIGRCVNSFSAGIAAMSQVFRVAVSNVRIPRSHKITSGFPCATTYSADISNSFIVLLIPGFNNAGRPHFPSAFSSTKFCMFRAPTCITSAYFAIKSTSRSLITSVIIASPVASFAFFSSFNPSSSIP